METKVCSKCGKEYPIDHYYTIKDKKTGEVKYRYNYCRADHYKMTKPTAKKWRKKYPTRWKEDVNKAQKAMFDRDKKGVYLLLTTKGTYIGKTNKYKHRVTQHKNNNFKGNMKYKDAKVLFSMLIVEENSAKRRSEIEKFWINLLKPSLNKVYNPDWVRESKPGGRYVRK